MIHYIRPKGSLAEAWAAATLCHPDKFISVAMPQGLFQTP